MKVTIVTGPFLPLPPAPGGAVERIWHGLAKVFAKRGHVVTLLCRSHPGQGRDEVIDGVRFIRIRGFERTRFIEANLLLDLAYSVCAFRLLPRADVLVLNVFWLPVLAVARPSAGKIVVNVARMPKGQMILYKRVNRLAAVSVAVERQILKQCPSVAPLVRVIPNPVEAETFRPPAVPRSWDGTKVIVYAGRIHPEKGLSLLMEGFRELAMERTDVALKVVGPHRFGAGGGGDGFLKSLKKLAKGLPVDFVGDVGSSAALASILQRAHIFVYPSLAENGESFGLAVLEAMATGLVPVVSALDCFKDFVTNGQTGVAFEHRGPGAGHRLAATLNSVLSDAGWAGFLGAKAAVAAARLRVEEIADRYLTDFRELLTSSSAVLDSGLGTPP